VNAIAANNRAIRHPGAREIATCKTPIDKLPAAAVNAMPAPRSTTAHYYRIVPASQSKAPASGIIRIGKRQELKRTATHNF
jgi:hypothetical protein